MRLTDPAPSPENPTLKAFQDLLREGTPDAAAREATLAQILAEESAKAALQLLNRLRPKSNSAKDPHWHLVRARLEAAVDRERTIRTQAWQLDPNRRTLRLVMEIRHPASGLNPAALGYALARLLEDGGFPIALGLEKKPRPMISLGPALPIGVEGHREWADVVLREPFPVETGIAKANAHAPAGLRLLEAAIIPNHSSSLVDLAQEARWHWEIPEELRALAEPGIKAFAAADTFEIEKTGKVGGTKTLKRMEVRRLVTRLEWKDQSLDFSTRIQPGEALSPLKLLAGILGVEPARITNLARTAVVLSDDPRLVQARKYEPKLHNIFEDAVLLESADDLPIPDEDDDDLLVER